MSLFSGTKASLLAASLIFVNIHLQPLIERYIRSAATLANSSIFGPPLHLHLHISNILQFLLWEIMYDVSTLKIIGSQFLNRIQLFRSGELQFCRFLFLKTDLLWTRFMNEPPAQSDFKYPRFYSFPHERAVFLIPRVNPTSRNLLKSPWLGWCKSSVPAHRESPRYLQFQRAVFCINRNGRY